MRPIDERGLPRQLFQRLALLLATVVTPPACHAQDRQSADQPGDNDIPESEQDFFDPVIKQESHNCGRHECDHDIPRQPPAYFVGFDTFSDKPIQHALRHLHHATPIKTHDSQDGTGLNANRIGIRGVAFRNSQQSLRQQQVTGRTYRQVLRETLDNSQHNRLPMIHGPHHLFVELILIIGRERIRSWQTLDCTLRYSRRRDQADSTGRSPITLSPRRGMSGSLGGVHFPRHGLAICAPSGAR